MGLQKVTAMTVCLCKLHNFLIDQREKTVPQLTNQDAAHGMIRGSILMQHQHQQEHNNKDEVPQQLLDGGEHFDNVAPNILRQE